MNNQDFIPEDIASKLAGVSATTLARFVEAGYLRVQSGGQGDKNYSKSEICSLFAIDADHPENDAYLASSIQVSVDNSTAEQEIDLPETSQQETVYWADTVSPDNQTTETQVEATPQETLDTPPSLKQIEDTYKDKAEITRLRNITMMQDKILELRENEIEELRKEREWLRTRVEKLEEKSDRDQMLLLAETQTIKRLVNLTYQKKPSSIRLALEWFGLVPQTKEVQINNSPGKVIE